MKPRRERTLDAYRDGQLSRRQRARVDRWLASDEESRRHLEQSEALGRAVRQAWTDGPPAPPADRILAAIRPTLRMIDVERHTESRWLRFLRAWTGGEAAGRSSWEWASAAGVVTASLLAAVLVSLPQPQAPREAQHLVAMPGEPSFVGSLDWPSSVYDLAEGDTPVTVYEKEGATVIYVGQEPDPDELSFGESLEDWA